MRDAPDAELMSAFRGGSREAFAVLVARHQGLVRAACLRQAPPGDAEDCIQAVFLVLARRPAAAGRSPALAAWLLRVAWYVCQRAQRGDRRRRRAEQQAAQAGSGRTGRPEALDHLDDCLAKLPERQRLAVSLRYLADREPEEIAAALGVSRDNAYQLMSRGLAALRTLLARRGVALGPPAVLALLAGESRAATASTATAPIAAALSATPSAGAASLASGACTAMTIATLAPAAAVAAALLSVGLATAAISAETAPPPAPVPAGKAASPAPPVPLEQVLGREFSCDFQDMPLPEVMATLAKETGRRVVLDPALATAGMPPVTLRVQSMQLQHILAFIEKSTGTTHSVRDGVLVIHAVPPVAGVDFSGADHELQDRLDQRITFDFKETPAADVVDFFSRVTGVRFRITSAAAAATKSSTVTLKAANMRMRDALKWVCTISNLGMRVANGVLIVDAAAPAATGVEPADRQAPAAPAGF